MPRHEPARQPAFAPVSVNAQDNPTILWAMLSNVAQGIAMFDSNHRLVGWNPRLQELLDLSDAALSSALTFKDFIGILAERGDLGTQPPRVEAAIRELTTALDQPYVMERMLPDGRILECERCPLPNGGLMIRYSDVSEQRHAEYLVKDSERQVRTILDKAPVALAVIAQDDGLLKHVNARFRKLFGIDRAISTEAIDLGAHLSSEDVAKIANAQTGDSSADFESMVRRTDGSEF